MTDRIRSLTVVLSADTRDDDARPLIAAISMLRGVAAVQADVADVSDYSAQVIARSELRDAIAKILWPRAER